MKTQNTIILGIFTAAFLLAGCGQNDPTNSTTPPAQTNAVPPSIVQPMPVAADTNQPLTDADIKQKIVGTWTVNDEGDKGIITFNADGTGSGPDAKDTNNLIKVKWSVTGGYLVVSETDPTDQSEGSTNKIVRLNDHEMVLDDDGDTVTFSR